MNCTSLPWWTMRSMTAAIWSSPKTWNTRRVSGLVEKPAAEEAPSNLYIVGRYLLSPLVMDLLADREPGKGGEIQLTDAMARSLEREAMYAVVIDPLSGYDTGTPSGWIATNALMAAADPRFADEFWEAVDERGGLVRR